MRSRQVILITQISPLLLSMNLLILSSPLLGQIPSPEEIKTEESPESAREVFKEIWSPYCPGQSVYDCASSQSASLRSEIIRKLNEGKTKEEVVLELQTIYGSKISMIPKSPVMKWTVIVLPLTVVGLAFLTILVRVLRVRASSRPVQTPLSKDSTERVVNWLKQSKNSK